MISLVLTIIALFGFGQTPRPDAHLSLVAPAQAAPVPAHGASPSTAPIPPLPAPPSYAHWLAQGDHGARVAAFEAELTRRGLNGILPTFELLRTAQDWSRCGASEYELPDPAYWQGAFDSLAIIKSDLAPLLGPLEIVSGYRHAALNACAGGAPASVHRHFGAFDIVAGGPDSRDTLIRKLCGWHATRGPALGAGLGIYSGRKFHIDARLKGYRSWGPDYRRASSPCMAPAATEPRVIG